MKLPSGQHSSIKISEEKILCSFNNQLKLLKYSIFVFLLY
ncbi:hypothetical protein HMPREF3206_01208 [Fusobacterium equinum]|uniref:Uncharacterized protein n=1 Tax=Fusobacterium equinum TaxID=134605 RepID=A0A133NC88_9FUSO|nr:hypothetical protein HMPREF3206_01208 [Fusobacterium equinum]